MAANDGEPTVTGDGVGGSLDPAALLEILIDCAVALRDRGDTARPADPRLERDRVDRILTELASELRRDDTSELAKSTAHAIALEQICTPPAELDAANVAAAARVSGMTIDELEEWARRGPIINPDSAMAGGPVAAAAADPTTWRGPPHAMGCSIDDPCTCAGGVGLAALVNDDPLDVDLRWFTDPPEGGTSLTMADFEAAYENLQRWEPPVEILNPRDPRLAEMRERATAPDELGHWGLREHPKIGPSTVRPANPT